MVSDYSVLNLARRFLALVHERDPLKLVDKAPHTTVNLATSHESNDL
jgi:hypothetical protein